MKIIVNSKLISRNKRIGQVMTIGSLAVLGFGLYLSFKPALMTWSFVALLAGFIMSQFGIFFGARWGKSPRPDELVSSALKGLDNKYALYHYKTPIPHLLIGPAGIWVLNPQGQKGMIQYDAEKSRWRQKGGNFYMKIFGQEGLGRPDLEVESLEKSLQSFFEKKLKVTKPVEINKVIIFTNEKADVDAENSPITAVPMKKLKELIRRSAKENPADLEFIQRLEQLLPTD